MSRLDDILMWHEVNITNPQAKEKIKALFLELIGPNGAYPVSAIGRGNSALTNTLELQGMDILRDELRNKVQDL